MMTYCAYHNMILAVACCGFAHYATRFGIRVLANASEYSACRSTQDS